MFCSIISGHNRKRQLIVLQLFRDISNDIFFLIMINKFILLITTVCLSILWLRGMSRYISDHCDWLRKDVAAFSLTVDG